MSKVMGIGLIVEDNSDYEAFKILIQRIIKKTNIKFRKSVSNGCGKLRRKVDDYAKNLHLQGCNMIVIVHDLDRNTLDELKKDLNDKILNSPAKYNYICIPVEEIEAWFLSDPEALQRTFNLEKKPKIKGAPETIQSPKEYIEGIVRINSNKTKIYLNTKHNSKLSENVSLELIYNKCQSFKELNDYMLQHKY